MSILKKAQYFAFLNFYPYYTYIANTVEKEQLRLVFRIEEKEQKHRNE